ncbi:hypothetical protein KR100_02380 [Synechococcus sp. KORDI-100]|nr:hypothetical protein KR100_02380 [Synechococcus sp. KORDI-100]
MFFGTANFGDSISLDSTNDADGFTAKLNADGSFAWATKVGGSSSVRVSDVNVLSDGSSIMTGLWSGTATFGGTSLTTNPTNYNDAFVAKLDSNGNYLWVTQAGGTQSDEPAAITTLSDGSSIITGSFSGTATFGSTSLTSTGNREIFIAKLDADGDYVWATKAGGGGHDHSKDIIALSDGSSIITGDFASGATFGSDTLQERGSSSAFIAKLDADGDFVWATKAGEQNCCSADSVYGYGVGALSDGSSLITGKFKGSVNFGSNALTSEGSSDDIFVAKIDANGDFVWVSQASGTSAELGQSITTLSDGSSLISGRFQGTATFGSTTLSSAGSNDIFVAKLDADGTFLWATKAGGTSSDYSIKLDAKLDGSSIIAGDINGTASFGSSDLTSPGNSDAFVAAMGANGSWTSSLVSQPSLTSATYDASSGALAVTGANLAANSGSDNDIDVSKLTLTGEGSNTYTLTSDDVELTSATAFSITLNAADQLQLAGLLNKDGTSSGAGTTYNIAAALNWNPGASSSPADSTGNAITVSNVAAPSLSSATYDDSSGVLALTGSNLPAYPGASNDIDVSKLTITGGSGSTYTLTTSDVELTSATAASITLNSTDQSNLDSLLNKNGTASTQGTTYNIAAADDWAPGADSSTDIADLTGNAITVSNVPAPSPSPSPSPGPSPFPDPSPSPVATPAATPTPKPAPTPTPTPTPSASAQQPPTSTPSTSKNGVNQFELNTTDSENIVIKSSTKKKPNSEISSLVITNTSTSQPGIATILQSFNNNTIVTATLPPSVSVTSEGPASSQSPNNAIFTITSSTTERADQPMSVNLKAVESYLSKLPETTRLNIRTITPQSKSEELNQPIIITGNIADDDDPESEALILDMRLLPTGNKLQIKNIAFSVILGETSISAGRRSNYIIADEQKQQFNLGKGDDTLIGGGDDDTIRGNSGFDVLVGDPGNDLIFGGFQNDTLNGGLGADNLKGGSGDDKLNGKKGKDTLIGQKGDDTIRGRRGNDLLLAKANTQSTSPIYGNNLLKGGTGDDTLKGGNGNDRLGGGSGDDVLIASQGNNTLRGHSGADEFILSTGNNTVLDFRIREEDHLHIESPSNILITQHNNDLLISTENSDLNSIIKNLKLPDLFSYQPELFS